MCSQGPLSQWNLLFIVLLGDFFPNFKENPNFKTFFFLEFSFSKHGSAVAQWMSA